MNTKSLLYNFVYVVLVIAFTYFYTAITINPTQMAEDMKRNNGFIPGVKPGKDTADYIDTVMSRITLPGLSVHRFHRNYACIGRSPECSGCFQSVLRWYFTAHSCWCSYRYTPAD